MKTVVILSAFLTPRRSGAEACAEEVARELADRFHVTIVTARLDRSLPRRDTLNGRVPVLRVGLGFTFDKWLYPLLAPLVVRRLKPDVIHAVLESYAGLAMTICRRLGIKARYILTCQSTNTSLLLGQMHRSADVVTVISRALLERAARLGRSDAVLIPNGLRTADIPALPKIPGRILFAGRLEPMKGVDTLLRSFAALPSYTTLHVAGSGRLRRSLEAQAGKLGIADRVTFLDFIPVPDVYQEFAAAEIFCGLSRSEALGNVFLEAQAAGCAVVATKVGGIPDIVADGQTGLLIPPDDPKAAATSLQRLLEDPALRERLAAAGHQHAIQYDWSLIAERYAQVYES
jgi:glycosyltransferase involved in cell wall biosynthesis